MLSSSPCAPCDFFLRRGAKCGARPDFTEVPKVRERWVCVAVDGASPMPKRVSCSYHVVSRALASHGCLGSPFRQARCRQGCLRVIGILENCSGARRQAAGGRMRTARGA